MTDALILCTQNLRSLSKVLSLRIISKPDSKPSEMTSKPRPRSCSRGRSQSPDRANVRLEKTDLRQRSIDPPVRLHVRPFQSFSTETLYFLAETSNASSFSSWCRTHTQPPSSKDVRLPLNELSTMEDDRFWFELSDFPVSLHACPLDAILQYSLSR